MATIKAVVLKHHMKADRTVNVKYALCHKSKTVYLDSAHYITKKDITPKFKIKDGIGITKIINDELHDYRLSISKLGSAIKQMSAVQIKTYLTDGDIAENEINFIDFANSHIEKLIKANKKGSTPTLQTVVNSLIDYFKTDQIFIGQITSSFLFEYESYLRGNRTLYRKTTNKLVEYKKEGLKAGLFNHMRDLRLLFNAAREKYNDEDLGIIRIKHYPFKKYKVGRKQATEKRALTVDQLIKIRDCQTKDGSRAELAKELFMFSFYMCGMNAVDIYEIKEVPKIRLNYNRAKTRGKRLDKAFISVKMVNEAKVILEKYAGKLQGRYSTSAGLNSAIDKGLSIIAKEIGFDFDFYAARHSFATLARNECRFSKDDVGMALNHSESSVTDIYIAKDWKIVDDVQEGVIKLLNK